MEKILPETRLETDRLTLRLPDESHARDFFELLTPEITRHMAFYPPKTVSEQRAVLRRHLRESQKGIAWHAAVFEKGASSPVGMCGVAEYFEETDSAEIWYWISASKQGRGYATEAARALCAHLFETCAANRIVIRADFQNEASRKVAGNLGAKLDGVLRSHAFKKGDLRDIAFHTLFPGELS